MDSQAENKKPIGRPTKYKPEYCQMLIDHMASGLSYECFGAVIDVARSTIYEWEKIPEFSDAKKTAFDKNRMFWEKAGLNGMFMGGKDNPFNATVWVFNMKNRFNWRDKSDVKEESKQDININIDADDADI
jgi:hypothetical protein